MATNGAVPIQACAFRIARLNADGSPEVSAVGMVQDDRPLVKVELKPQLEAGTEITPKSGCGVPVISYKDCDRYKRWDVTVDFGDFDFELLELAAGGSILTSPGSSGRNFTDGATTLNSTALSSPALAAFTVDDVGRSVTGTGIPNGTTIVEFVSSTEVRMSAPATATGSGLSITLGAIGTSTIGYQSPKLLLENCPNGVSLELWQKLIVRGTGYQGTVGYPSAGTPTTPGSGWLRWGIFRAFLWFGTMTMENKETMPQLTGWAIENPNFGTGPADDWRTTMAAGVGAPLDTTGTWDAVADFELPTPLQPGYQAVA